MPETPSKVTSSKAGPRRIIWLNVLTVVSAAILISAEVFGAAFAGGWAVANVFSDWLSVIGLGGASGVYALQILFFLLGLYVMARFVRNAMRIEPFTTSS